LDSLDTGDRRRLLALPFKLIPARHRLGLITPDLQVRLLEARHVFAEGFGSGAPSVEFLDSERFNPAISIQDNILFGRLSYGRARSAVKIGALIGEVVEKLDLRRAIMEVGLDFPVGIGGARLSSPQRQKLAIARSVMKRPDVLVLDEATAVLDGAAQSSVMRNLFEEFKGRALIWLVHRASLGKEFDYTLVLEGGKVVEQGKFSEINKPGTLLNQLVLAG
jgi:ABC-type multidrug transport system fused ATPase/permease subunit